MKTQVNTLGKVGRKAGIHRACKDKDGYVYVQAPKGHPAATKKGLIFEHRLVMESFLGRYLTRAELVHHRNGDQSDNRIENLELTDRQHHATHHNQGNVRRCIQCGVICIGGLRKTFCSAICKNRSNYLKQKPYLIARQSAIWRSKRIAKNRKCPTCKSHLEINLNGNRKYCNDACDPWH